MDLEWPLVGREDELAVMTAAMNSGAPGLFLVGPAGMGKTRLAMEVLAEARARGWETAVVRANPSAATIPFGAFASVLPVVQRSGEVGRADVVSGACQAVVELAGGTRLLVVVDDGHQLDDASVTLLGMLAERPEVVLVVTARSDETAPAALTVLWKDELLTRIEVRPLSGEASVELARLALGGPIDGVTAQALSSVCGGNPLFLRELVVGALESGALFEQAGMWRSRSQLSPSTRLAELIELRLGSLGAAEQEALEILSVGEPIGLDDLGALLADDAVDALERRGLVQVVAEGRRTNVLFGHPMYREVVRKALPVLQRRQICARLADLVERRGARRREDVLRVALWRLDSGGGHATLLLRGAEQAHLMSDLDLAERLARAAWIADPSADTGRLLGQTLDGLGRHQEAEEILAEASELAGDGRDGVRAAFARSSNLFRGLGRAPDARSVLVEAERTITDPELRAELQGLQASQLVFEGRLLEAIALTDPLIEQGTGRAFVSAALPNSVAHGLCGRTMHAIELAEHGLQARLALGDQTQLVPPGMFLFAYAWALLLAGRLTEAEETARSGYQAATEHRLADGQAWFAVNLGRTTLAQGRVQSSALWFREAALVFDDLGHPAARWGHAGLANALALVGDVDGAEAALADLDAEPATPVRMLDPELERCRASVLAARGDHSAARELLNRAASDAAANDAASLEVMALHDCARYGNASEVLSRMRALGDVIDGPFMDARLMHVEALASGSAAHFDAAAAMLQSVGADLFAAEAAAGSAAAYQREGLARRAAEARRRASQLASRCEGARPVSPLGGQASTPLTRREREIATLAARGQSNDDIARRLVISLRTVENHLHHAYEKLGITGRDELAAALEPETTTS